MNDAEKIQLLTAALKAAERVIGKIPRDMRVVTADEIEAMETLAMIRAALGEK